ncbi:hypothetical protein ACWCV9_19760 [Streptomyces sp. NPDC001606]
MNGQPGTGPADGMEDVVRRVLGEAGRATEVPPWSAAAVRKRVHRMRRRRRAVIAVPLAAVVAATGALLLPGRQTSGTEAPPRVPARPRPPASPSPSLSSRPSPAGPLVVAPGARVALGHGVWVTLAPDQYCLDHGPGSERECHSVTGRHQRRGSLSLDVSDDRSYQFLMPVYVGPGKPTRIVVRRGGSPAADEARVVTLPGTPGFVIAYAWRRPPPRQDDGPTTMTAYDARGHVVATFEDPF